MRFNNAMLPNVFIMLYNHVNCLYRNRKYSYIQIFIQVRITYTNQIQTFCLCIFRHHYLLFSTINGFTFYFVCILAMTMTYHSCDLILVDHILRKLLNETFNFSYQTNTYCLYLPLYTEYTVELNYKSASFTLYKTGANIFTHYTPENWLLNNLWINTLFFL